MATGYLLQDSPNPNFTDSTGTTYTCTPNPPGSTTYTCTTGGKP